MNADEMDHDIYSAKDTTVSSQLDYSSLHQNRNLIWHLKVKQSND